MRATFQGFRRADGRVGVRNHVLVLGINGLAARAAEKIAANVPQAVCVASRNGRGMVEPDIANFAAQMTGLARNPNVGAVLVVGVDEKGAEAFRAGIAPSGKPVETVTFAEAQEDALTVMDLGTRRLAALARAASRAWRDEAPLSELVFGVECGHSDATSGVAGNGVLGAAVDRLVDAGATVMVGETVEWLGAEDLLAGRARDPETGRAIRAAVDRREALVVASGTSLLGNNPGEENIRGGLSTIEEKALGAMAKTGSRPIDGLIALTEAPPRTGLYLMDAPFFSPESLTGFAGAGAQLVLFSTGPGNSYASAIAPTIKVSARAEAVARLPQQIDFDASPVFAGREDFAAASARLIDLVCDVADGFLTWGEVVGEGLEVPARLRESL